MKHIPKPHKNEYPAYADQYISLLANDGLILQHLADSLETNLAFIKGLSEEQLLYRYAEGKWSIKEILVHIIDDERIYAYRALRFARGDSTEIPGFDQDAFAAQSFANERPLPSILKEYSAIRQATIALFESFDDDVLLRMGVADGNRNSVRALLYHIAGHELRHFTVIRERYL